MKIIFKFILTSIREKKFRTFLLLFAITLSSALFFASNALNMTMQDMYVEVMKKYYGSSTIIINRGPESNWYLSTQKAESHPDRLEYAIGAVDGSAQFKPNSDESVVFSLRGFTLDDLRTFSRVSISESGGLDPFAGRKIIVSSITADRYGWELGDVVKLEVQGEARRFSVAGIALPTGVFQAGFDRNDTIIVPRDYLASLYGIRGKALTIYARTRTDADIPEMIRTLRNEYPRYSVRQPIEPAEREQFVGFIRTPLLLMSIMIIFMSIFIVYSTFRVITVERLPIIGTFRSIGAARKTTDLVLIVESLVYGVASGLAGLILGIGILAVMTGLMAYIPWAGFTMKIEIHFTALHLLTAFLVAVAVSLAGAIVPIVKTSRIPVKDIVLNSVEHKSMHKILRIVLGSVLLAFSLAVPPLAPKALALPVNSACLLSSMAAMIALVPALTSLLVGVLKRFYLMVFGNEGVLAAKNLRENKNILNNISLLSLSISSLILIFTISFSAITAIVGFYTDARFGIWMWANMADRTLEPSLRAVPGVADITHTFSVRDARIGLGENRINLISGIDTRDYLEFWDFGIPPELLSRLDDGRNILMTEVLKEKLEVKIGQILTLELKNGRKKYEVIGFFASTRNGGNYAIVSEKYLKADADLQYYDEIYVKTDKPPAETASALKSKLARRWPWISTIDEMKANELKSNSQLMTLLQGFAIMTLVMGLFGVFNNYIISFVERKRHLAIFRSVGMSRKQIVRMMLMEALSGGLIGGIAGTAGGAVSLFIGGYLLRSMDANVDMLVSPAVLVLCMAASLVVSLAASLSPALKSGRLNIIEAIKYE